MILEYESHYDLLTCGKLARQTLLPPIKSKGTSYPGNCNSNLSNFTSCKSEGSHYGWKGAGFKLKLEVFLFLLYLKENQLSTHRHST